MPFKLLKKSQKSEARLGVLKTVQGMIKTPFFMPVATQGTVKHLSGLEMRKLKAQILLANTYHLMLKPGEKLVKKAGGLHKFMDWPKPILTDSGGFQVFSLAGNKKKSGESLVSFNLSGVKFRSYLDGKTYNLTPEKSIKIQYDLGVDIAVCLDVCPALPASQKQIEEAVSLTSRWAGRAKNYYKKLKPPKPLLLAVVQGGLDKELRFKSLNDLVKIGFDGYNIGGLSVGETTEEMYEVLSYLAPAMPADKPRYLMGVGYPEQIIQAVKNGIDMFDCVIPTREGRHGRLFSFKKANEFLMLNFQSASSFYKAENITLSKYAKDLSAINAWSRIFELKNLSKAYLHYLFKIKEPLGQRLATLNNLEFYLNLMEAVRSGIKKGAL